jgi:c-di-GMP-binding flagellar brake protein YcgR
MNIYIERRKYKRINVSIPVKYREVTSDSVAAHGELIHDLRCVNISRSGMQIISDEKWSGKDECLIEAEFIMSGRVIRLIARVVWKIFDNSIGMHKSGIEFIVIKSGDLEVIGQIV